MKEAIRQELHNIHQATNAGTVDKESINKHLQKLYSLLDAKEVPEKGGNPVADALSALNPMSSAKPVRNKK